LKQIVKSIALMTALLVGVAACDDAGTSVSGDSATLKVLLTDAPSDYVAAAWVDIGAVQLVPGEGDGEENEGGIITLVEDATEGYVDLLELQGTATAQLAELEIEAGTYSQLRLIVDSAEVELVDGYQFNDGGTSKTLFVPSGAQTGIKLNLEGSNGEGDGTAGGVEIAPGETVLVLDFDVNQSFVIQGNPESPAGINGMLFTPTLRVVVNDVAGSIAGTVTAAADSMNVVGLTVTAEPLGDGTLEAYQTRTATATTDSAGAYTIHYLVPGDYSVSVAADSGFVGEPASTDVTVGEAADVTGIDFEIVEDAGT
jgi:hypothetical protein